jgi:hypothetical protein
MEVAISDIMVSPCHVAYYNYRFKHWDLSVPSIKVDVPDSVLFPRQNPKLLVYTVRTCSASEEHDRQCAYNVTLRGVRVTILVVGKQ